MGIGDGTVGATAKILDNGPDASRANIVLVAEGFRDVEQGDFESACADFVANLQAEPWYPVLGGAINVHRLNVSSDESGADDPAICPDGETGSGTMVATFFDATYCNSGLRRCLSGDDNLVRDTLDVAVPAWLAAAVLVNSSERGGCASGNVFWTALSDDWQEVVLHELGHSVFGLADEYHYRAGCDSGETTQDNAPAFEPSDPNITTVTNPATLKWRHHLTPEVPIPTMENPDCGECDDRPNVLADDHQIGLFEGAGYFHCGRYRPAYLCRMRKSVEPFCAVCLEAAADALSTFIAPTPTLEVTPTLVDFGDVGIGFTQYRSFAVRNRRVDFPGTLAVTLAPPSGGFAYAPGTETSFALPPPILESFTTRPVFVAFTAPDAGGPDFAGSLQVTSPDATSGSPATVDLLARAVPPPPVDSVLVIDRSDSMSGATGVPGQTKIDHAIEAAQLYVSLLKENDRIGLVRYNDHADDPGDVLLELEEAGDPVSGAGRAHANAALVPANLTPAGLTTIGGGILLGSSVLDAAVADSRALVVLTDGIQITPPDIPEATAAVAAKTPRQRVFAVGLGLNQLEDRLQQIASVTNGVAQITGDLVGYKEFLLHKLYVQILSDASDEAFVTDPRALVPPGEARATTVWICDLDVSADFVVVFRRSTVFPKYMEVWLEAPDGTVVTAADAGPLPNVRFVTRPGHVFFRWGFPAFPARPEAHVGAWRVWVRNLTGQPSAVFAGTAGGAPLYYSVLAKARSDFRLGGRVEQALYAPGSPFTVVLEPTLFGVPAGVDEPVEVVVTRPDGVARTLRLDPDALGAYRGVFTDTPLVGSYLVTAEAHASSPAGNHLTRYRQMSALIFVPGAGGGGQTGSGGNGQTGGGGGGQTGGGGGTGPGGGGGGGLDPRECDEARYLLRRLAHLLARCCKETPRSPQPMSPPDPPR